ncbi:nuclear transport factor 2 family protein [bacterium]|nr:nuclear transport factor 2 family protein [bacterium]
MSSAISKQIVEEALEGLLKAIRKAFKVKNTDVINRFLDDQFELIWADGCCYNRKAVLKLLGILFQDSSHLHLLDVNVNLNTFDDVAWGHYREAVQFGGSSAPNYFWITFSLRRFDTKWLLTYIHLSKAANPDSKQPNY